MANPNPSPATRFKPGQSGNPTGRRGPLLTPIIREVLESNTIQGKKIPAGQTVADVLAVVFIQQALKGKFPFAKEVIDRIDGKASKLLDDVEQPPQRIETPDADDRHDPPPAD